MKYYFVFVFILQLIIIYAENTGDAMKTNTTEEYYNPYENENDLFLWKNLFIKVNTLLVATDKLNNNYADLNKKIEDISKRQQEQEKEIKTLVEHVQRMNFTNYNFNTEVNNGPTLSINTNNWTTILRRIDGSVDFYRNWTDYKAGFGNPPQGEFFIGLQKLHELTTSVPKTELKIVLEDWEGNEFIALYDGFQIADETEKYKIKLLGNYSGNAEDSMAYHRDKKFSTFDNENDNSSSTNCAMLWKGAWWFDNCYYSHLTGPYKQKENANATGISWFKLKGHYYSFKKAEMLIREKN
ncbi:microfibril-associated glycoprotein 4-like [Musca autumnalis]|uniref:microfibril-associated glycoprotein 4-like n=1 Tax=Musca autumnalis TaxID=221902 RepID=UPI003CECAA6E